MKIVQKQFYEKPSFYVKLVILFVIVYFCSENENLLPWVLAIFAIVFIIRSEWGYHINSAYDNEMLNLKEEFLKEKDLTILYQEELLEAYKIKEGWNDNIYRFFFDKNDLIAYNYGTKMGELFAYTFIASPDKELISYYESYLESIKDKKVITFIKDIIKQLNKLHEKGMNELTLSDAIMLKIYVDMTMKYNNQNLLNEGFKLRMFNERLSKQIIYIAKKVYKIKIEKEKKVEYFWQSAWFDAYDDN